MLQQNAAFVSVPSVWRGAYASPKGFLPNIRSKKRKILPKNRQMSYNINTYASSIF